MEKRHIRKIEDNISFLVKDVDYERLRPELLKQKLFPARHLERMEERSNKELELFLAVQRRGPTAFRRLVASLAFSGHDEAVQVLIENEESLLLDSCANTDPFIEQSLDLTDSPIQPNQIVIEPASVLREENSMTYKMTSNPRGMALIIDNEDFENLPPRRGSHIDSDCLAKLYQQLGFWVVMKKNLRKLSLEFELFSFATDTVHHQLDMAIITVLSHGENGSIICTNGEKIAIEDILSKFNNKEAPPLKGKPKFFIFQACRGLKIDPGVETDGPDDVKMGENLEDQQYVSYRLPSTPDIVSLVRDPSYEDMFVSYATIPTYVAYRNNMKGSWFIQCLCKVFMRYSCEEDLVTLLQRVSQELKVYCTTKGEKQINETLLRGVSKKLFFNPGLLNGQIGRSHQNTNQTNYLLKATQREAALERTGLIGLPTMPNFPGHEQLDEIWSGLGSGLELGFEQCAV